MSKNQKEVKLKHRLEYVGVRFAFWMFRALGKNRACNLAAWVACKVGPLLSAHKTARNNIEQAMPELSSEQIDNILHDMWDNLGRNIGELPFIREITLTSPDVDVEGIEILEEIKKSKTPVLFLAAHYGPWELCAAACRYCDNDVHIVYRAANNPLVDDYFQQNREVPECSFIPKGKRGARALLKALKDAGGVVLLNDQKQNTGLPIPFFGREAMTATAIADLAVRDRYPIIPLRAERQENGRVKLSILPAFYAPTEGERQEKVVELLTQINGIYEDWIRARPDHWFWVHNRW
ncbi:lauroyl acyltransferase [Sneathiella sp. P13V-1]|uniref:lysophospholipid acyltransferase family protein n=1 Tax=Sneathiella sp. P13V-1 TaxID=2697366 RepID=UPI00187B1E7B|nr:lysophospholipid acyltransferase family protein [Sneathiella sp. P13V-1]MBE7636828.1 lauroyl acyltransferase [Sneathiella sp. P13V-1]